MGKGKVSINHPTHSDIQTRMANSRKSMVGLMRHFRKHFAEKGENLDQQLHDEINAALQLSERKPKLIEALLQERRVLDSTLTALGYVPPKRTRKPRAPAPLAAEGSVSQPTRRRTRPS